MRRPQQANAAALDSMVLGGQSLTPQTIPATWASGPWGSSGGVARCRHCDRVFSFVAVAEPEPETEPEISYPEPEPIEYQEPLPVEHQEPPPDDRRDVCYPVACCPECGAKRPKVTSTRGKIRHHKCVCGYRFKSVER